jgi:hypothetical protein
MILKKARKVPHACTNNKVAVTISTKIANTGRITQHHLRTINLFSKSVSTTDFKTFLGYNGVTEHSDRGTSGSATTETNLYTRYLHRPARHQHPLLTCLRIRGLAVRVRPSAPQKLQHGLSRPQTHNWGYAEPPHPSIDVLVVFAT